MLCGVREAIAVVSQQQADRWCHAGHFDLVLVRFILFLDFGEHVFLAASRSAAIFSRFGCQLRAALRPARRCIRQGRAEPDVLRWRFGGLRPPAVLIPPCDSRSPVHARPRPFFSPRPPGVGPDRVGSERARQANQAVAARLRAFCVWLFKACCRASNS